MVISQELRIIPRLTGKRSCCRTNSVIDQSMIIECVIDQSMKNEWVIDQSMINEHVIDRV